MADWVALGCVLSVGGLWEVRSNFPSRIARVIFAVDSREMILLNGFIKKTSKTPVAELDLAKKRDRRI
jgi:phage-related protein